MVEEKKGFFQKLKTGLKKTSGYLKSGLDQLFSSEKKIIAAENIEYLEKSLIEADVGVDLSMEIVESIENSDRYKTVEEIKVLIKEKMLSQFLDIERKSPQEKNLKVILFVGINGAGKTTTIAKLANRLKQQGESVILGAGDTFRAAAVEQLSIWASRLDLPIVKHNMGADPAAVAHDACESALSKNADYVLLDTAGRLHNQNSLMEELKKIVRVVGKKVDSSQIEKILILDGNAGQNSFVQAKSFQQSIGIDGIVVSKLDGTAKGGIVISVEKQLGIPVKYLGVGESVEDLVDFEPNAFIDALLDGG